MAENRLIRIRLVEKGWDQKTLAEATGIHASDISRIVGRGWMPSERERALIASALEGLQSAFWPNMPVALTARQQKRKAK